MIMLCSLYKPVLVTGKDLEGVLLDGDFLFLTCLGSALYIYVGRN